jgi:3-hydroxybutyryl-CoA dehydratase
MRVGERFGTSVTVTETHHVDEEFSRKSIFGGRILHGPFTSALISAPVGMYFSGTARNQKGELAVEADGKILVSARPSR